MQMLSLLIVTLTLISSCSFGGKTPSYKFEVCDIDNSHKLLNCKSKIIKGTDILDSYNNIVTVVKYSLEKEKNKPQYILVQIYENLVLKLTVVVQEDEELQKIIDMYERDYKERKTKELNGK